MIVQAEQSGFVSPHVFDDIVTTRPLTHDLFGGITRKWRVIYADPPWNFSNWSEEGEDRNANQHYDTMPIEEIMKLPVADIADDDAVLFLWVTDPTLHHAMRLIQAWGFEYKTVAFYWAKTWESADQEALHPERSFPMNTGYITRGNPEQIWIATRGNPKKRLHNIGGILKPDMGIRRLQFAPRGQHSEKPDKFYGLIERLYDGPYLEMFARRTAPGWASWGNQVGLLDEGGVRTKKKKERPVTPAPLFD